MKGGLNQNQTPLLDALKVCADRPHAAFYAPGHKRGQGISSRLSDCFGTAIFRSDLPELPELDNLFAPEGVIQAAQELAAEAFGAEATWFLVNGSTCGVEAAILAACGPGESLILPRNVHQSAIAGLILSGAVPIWITPEYEAEWDLTGCVTPAAIATALKEHPEAKAVLIVAPTYHGINGDVAAIAAITHAYHLPLLVDEAHGSHFGFHPDLPRPALSVGADLVVQSTHKVLGAMTQASMLHVQGNRLDRDRLQRALQLLQSTSPSYLLLASLDAARQQMATKGHQLLTQTLALAEQARTAIGAIPGLVAWDLTAPAPGFASRDRTRLTVRVAELGVSGFLADTLLHQDLGVTAELPSLQHLTFIVSLGNTRLDIQQLIQGLTTLASQFRGQEATPQGLQFQQQLRQFRTLNRPSLAVASACTAPAIAPRSAFFAPPERVALTAAIGRVSAELICPYPPGIPVLFPGEAIAAETLDYLQQILAWGGKITGCSDPSLQTMNVVPAIHDDR
jgi:arginine/lysine/ornithine decarboxylase